MTDGRKPDDTGLIELSDFNNQTSLNIDSSINKTFLKEKSALLTVDLEKLYRDYFIELNFKEFSISKVERMYNDFRIFLKLIENYKIENRDFNFLLF